MRAMDDDRDELAEDDRQGSSVKDVEAIDLDAAADLEVDGEDELTGDDVADDEDESEDDADGSAEKETGRRAGVSGEAAEREIQRIDEAHARPRGVRAPAAPSRNRKKIKPPVTRRRVKAK